MRHNSDDDGGNVKSDDQPNTPAATSHSYLPRRKPSYATLTLSIRDNKRLSRD